MKAPQARFLRQVNLWPFHDENEVKWIKNKRSDGEASRSKFDLVKAKPTWVNWCDGKYLTQEQIINVKYNNSRCWFKSILYDSGLDSSKRKKNNRKNIFMIFFHTKNYCVYFQIMFQKQSTENCLQTCKGMCRSTTVYLPNND